MKNKLTPTPMPKRSFLLFLAALLVTLAVAACGQTQEVAEEDETVGEVREPFIIGEVVYPNQDSVPNATVLTRPFTASTTTDSSGVFYFLEPVEERTYTFIAEHPEEDLAGEMSVEIAGAEPPYGVRIVLGRDGNMQPIEADSLRRGAGGTGIVRPDS